MPIYEYHCKACNSTFEELVFGDETPSCPKCKSMDTEKLISRCSCHFGGGMGSFDLPTPPASSGGGCAGCSGGNCSTCGH